MAFRIVESDTGGKLSFRFDAICTAPNGSDEFVCGSINGVRARTKVAGRAVWSVKGIYVHDGKRRLGIATKLYEAAAQEACRRRSRLASFGDNRNPGAFSHDFWAKQERKGRVTKVSTRSAGDAPTYVITACPPPSLEGARLRRR